MKNSRNLSVGFGLLALASTGWAATSYSETSSAVVPSFGIQAGLNFENAKTPSQINSNTRTGFTVGINLDLPIVSFFSVQPELNYSKRGFNLVNGGGIKADVNQHSIEVPVLAKVGFGEKIRPYVFAGPMATWNISNELVGDIGGKGKSISYNPRTFDAAVVGGIGIQASAFFANVRYQVGILDLSNSADSYQSQGFKLLAGLKF